MKIEETQIAFRLLGDIYLKREDANNAIRFSTKMDRFPENPNTAPANAYMFAMAYLISNKPEQAIKLLSQTATRYPTNKPVKDLLLSVKSYYKIK